MITSTLFNLGSLILGLIAWIVPFTAAKQQFNRSGIYMIISFSACSLALCLQFFEINYRVNIQDLAAIIDTIGTLKWIAVILITITIGLNMFAFLAQTEK